MEIITIDGMVEHDFRRSIEDMLRLDQVDEAAARLRALLEPCTGPSEVLPPRFLQVTADDVEIAGWERLGDRVLDHGRAGHPITAIGVTLADARALGGPGPYRGRLKPFIKTFYFSDDAYPFSGATRDDLLDGYSRDGFEWQGDYQATDATLSVTGIDDLHGAIVELEGRLLDRASPPEDEIRAGTIGACYVAVLIHQALRDTIRTKGLPRPLCIFAACDGVYPFFDAPVAGSDEYRADETVAPIFAEPPLDERDEFSEADEEDLEEPLPGEASLLGLISRKGLKAPVMVLGADDAEEAARYGEMAEAQRLGLDDEAALKGVLEGIHDSQLAEIEPDGEDFDCAEPDVLRQRAELEESLALVIPARPEPTVEDTRPTDREDHTAAQDIWDEDGRVAGYDVRIPGPPDVWPVPLDQSETASPEAERYPPAAPAGHSLRARIKLAEPDKNDTLGERLSAVWTRVTSLFVSR